MSKHTPGPWVVYENPDGLPIVTKKFSVEDLVHIRMPSWASGHEVDANARLIAAAPELLEALLRVDTFCSVVKDSVPSDIVDDVRAAIKLAVGE